MQVFNAFTDPKSFAVAALSGGGSTDAEQVHLAVMNDTPDPLPGGIAPNRDTLEQLIGHAATQKILLQAVSVEDLFAKSLRRCRVRIYRLNIRVKLRTGEGSIPRIGARISKRMWGRL